MDGHTAEALESCIRQRLLLPGYMTPEMIDRSRVMAAKLGLENLEYRPGVIEDLPIEDGWVDVVISNGVINLCPDKIGVYGQIFRVLAAGGRMTIADICLERPVPEEALRDIDSGLVELLVPCRVQGGRR